MWLWTALACSGPGPSDDDPTDGDTDTPAETGTAPLVVGPYKSWTDPVTSALRTGLPGARVREGRIHWSKWEDCAPIVQAIGTCHGAHPASPYGFFDFPEDADQDDGVLDYQLDQHEAVVFVGHTPPDSRYFSFNQYQYEQQGDDGERRIIFGTLAPSLNMLEISTATSPMSGGIRDYADTPFGDYTVVVFTANEATAARITDALTPLLEAAGYGPEIVNVHPMALADDDEAQALIDGGMPEGEVFTIRMGYGDDKDTFNVVIRVAAPVDPEHPYLFSETIDAAAFKVAFDDPPPRDPFPWPEFPPEDQTGEAEHPRVRDSRDAVVQMVQDRLIPAWLDTELVASDNIEQKTGASCINLLDKCGGNNDDARYLRAEDRFYWPDVEEPFSSLFVVGVNHPFVAAQDPNAPRVTYSSVTLNNYTRGFGVRTLLDHELEGSLDYWLGAAGISLDQVAGFTLDPAVRDSVYIVQFARDCEPFGWPEPNPYCVEFDDGVLGVCPFDKFWTVERVYLNQTSATAPHQSGVFEPVIVAAGPRVEWVEAGIGGAWSLNVPPVPRPDLPEWCTVTSDSTGTP